MGVSSGPSYGDGQSSNGWGRELDAINLEKASEAEVEAEAQALLSKPMDSGMKHLLTLVMRIIRSHKHNRMERLKDVLAWFYGIKRAKAEHRRNMTLRVLKYLYG